MEHTDGWGPDLSGACVWNRATAVAIPLLLLEAQDLGHGMQCMVLLYSQECG
jgi:hypothetical protein